MIACFPVYRSYISEEGVHEADRQYVDIAVRRADAAQSDDQPFAVPFVRDMLLLRYPDRPATRKRAEQRRFAGKFQQVTSPVMAKGVEDTAFYVYNRLVSLNEVGGDPARFGTSARRRASRTTKTGRAIGPGRCRRCPRTTPSAARTCAPGSTSSRNFPAEWRDCVARWSRLNAAASHRYRRRAGSRSPTRSISSTRRSSAPGRWSRMTPEEYASFVERMQAYMVKALHEAKVHTSWINPNEAYDEAFRQFVARILDEELSGDSWPTYERFSGESAISACSTRFPRRCFGSSRLACPTRIREPSSGTSAWWTPTIAALSIIRAGRKCCVNSTLNWPTLGRIVETWPAT